MFVQLAGSAGSVTKGSVQSLRATTTTMAMTMIEIHPKECETSPGKRIFVRTIVSERKRRAKLAWREGKKRSPRGRRDFFFRERREVAFHFQERELGKAKEQEEVIRCSPLLSDTGNARQE